MSAWEMSQMFKQKSVRRTGRFNAHWAMDGSQLDSFILVTTNWHLTSDYRPDFYILKNKMGMLPTTPEKPPSLWNISPSPILRTPNGCPGVNSTLTLMTSSRGKPHRERALSHKTNPTSDAGPQSQAIASPRPLYFWPSGYQFRDSHDNPSSDSIIC